MKTNVSIKFNSIEEYRVIEKKLEEMGYVNDKKWNQKILSNSSTHVVSCYAVGHRSTYQSALVIATFCRF